MRISHNAEIEGRRIVSPIGRIEASSQWFSGAAGDARATREDEALNRLKALAADYDADAIIEVGFDDDGCEMSDLSAIPLRRVCAHGIAVRLSRG